METEADGLVSNEVEILGEKLYIELGYYRDHTRAIQLWTEDREPYCTASVWIPDVPAGYVAIKNYSENEGILDVLIKAGVIAEPTEYRKSKFVDIPICKLLVKQTKVIDASGKEAPVINLIRLPKSMFDEG